MKFSKNGFKNVEKERGGIHMFIRIGEGKYLNLVYII
jgi:hypothetical protein